MWTPQEEGEAVSENEKQIRQLSQVIRMNLRKEEQRGALETVIKLEFKSPVTLGTATWPELEEITYGKYMRTRVESLKKVWSVCQTRVQKAREEGKVPCFPEGPGTPGTLQNSPHEYEGGTGRVIATGPNQKE